MNIFLLIDSLSNTKDDYNAAKQEIEEQKKEISNLNYNISTLKSNLDSEQSERTKAENKLAELKQTFSNYIPIVIKDVKVANAYKNGDIETDYGSTIYSSRSMYLKPRISYVGFDSKNITLCVKLYDSSGTLSQSASSSANFSYKYSFTTSDGFDTEALDGWGNSTMGHWKSGTYRFEFWYGDVCLKSYSFSVY